MGYTFELFSGTESFSKVAKSRGLKTFTVDFDPEFNPDLCINILELSETDFAFIPYIVWASPPCNAFSVAAIGKNWDKDTRKPKSESALLGLEILEHTIKLISEVKPTYWFIENPRGMMRKVIDELFVKYKLNAIRNTVTYCQYGDSRMKPTDIWTNFKEWKPKEMCKNGAPCHIAAPRGKDRNSRIEECKREGDCA
jgi:site-specific DNA-cytosine methylase